MKILKLLIPLVLVAGLIAGVVPALAISNSSSSGDTAELECNTTLYEEGNEIWSEVEDIPEYVLECIPNDGSETDPNRCQPRVMFHTGLVTNIIKDRCGNIIRITIINKYARLATFVINDCTRFYYEEGIPQTVERGDLVTIVTRPWPIFQPRSDLPCEDIQYNFFEAWPSADSGNAPERSDRYNFFEAWPSDCSCNEPGNVIAPGNPGVIPPPKWRVALAVVVHAPRPWAIYGTVSEIDLDNQTMVIESNQGDVKVKVNDDTRYVFLPRPWIANSQVCSEDSDGANCVPNKPGLEDILVGDTVGVYAPTVEYGVRVAKVVVVLRHPHPMPICGVIESIDEDNQTITLNIGLDLDETADSDVADTCYPQLVTIEYTSSTVFILHGHPGADVGELAVAWCKYNTEGDLVATRVIVRA